MPKRRARDASLHDIHVEPELVIDYADFEQIILPATAAAVNRQQNHNATSRPSRHSAAATKVAAAAVPLIVQADLDRIVATLTTTLDAHERKLTQRLDAIASALQALTTDVSAVRRSLHQHESAAAQPTMNAGEKYIMDIGDQLPLRTFDELLAFERTLDAVAMAAYLKSLIDMSNTVLKPNTQRRRLVSAVYTDELLCTCTWKGIRAAVADPDGVRRWEKPPLGDTKLPYIIMDVLQESAAPPGLRRNEVEGAVRKYVLHCNDRIRTKVDRSRRSSAADHDDNDDDDDDDEDDDDDDDDGNESRNAKRFTCKEEASSSTASFTPLPITSTKLSPGLQLRTPSSANPAIQGRSYPIRRHKCREHLPLRTYDEVLRFERSLLDEDDLTDYLLTLGGRSVAKQLYAMVNAVYHNDVLYTTTWKGIRSPAANAGEWLKPPMQVTRMPHLIVDLVLRSAPHMDVDSVEKMFKSYALHATDRHNKAMRSASMLPVQSIAAATAPAATTDAAKPSAAANRSRNPLPSSDDDDDDNNDDDDDEEYDPRPPASKRRSQAPPQSSALGSQMTTTLSAHHRRQMPGGASTATTANLQSITALRLRFLDCLPLATYDQLVRFERTVDAAELERYLGTIADGGKLPKIVSRLGAALYTNDLLCTMTWRGIRAADGVSWAKGPLCGTRLPSVIVDLCHRITGQTYDECEGQLKSYLARAHDRARNRQQTTKAPARQLTTKSPAQLPARVEEDEFEDNEEDARPARHQSKTPHRLTAPTSHRHKCRAHLPLATYEAILKFEGEHLDADDLRDYLYPYRARNLDATIARLFQQIYTPQLLAGVTWLGIKDRQRGVAVGWLMPPLGPTQIPHIIIDLCLKLWPHLTRVRDVLPAVKSFMMKSTDRLKLLESREAIAATMRVTPQTPQVDDGAQTMAYDMVDEDEDNRTEIVVAAPSVGEPQNAEFYASMLPLHAYDDMLDFEDGLDEADLKRYLHCEGAACRDVPALVERAVRAVYGAGLLAATSWSGERAGGGGATPGWLKEPLRVTKLPYLIMEVCEERFALRSRAECQQAFKQCVAAEAARAMFAYADGGSQKLELVDEEE